MQGPAACGSEDLGGAWPSPFSPFSAGKEPVASGFWRRCMEGGATLATSPDLTSSTPAFGSAVLSPVWTDAAATWVVTEEGNTGRV
jgi:hypothetical protein